MASKRLTELIKEMDYAIRTSRRPWNITLPLSTMERWKDTLVSVNGDIVPSHERQTEGEENVRGANRR